jgi:hypothetical protein
MAALEAATQSPRVCAAEGSLSLVWVVGPSPTMVKVEGAELIISVAAARLGGFD